jgi:hypothetical protein
MFVNHFYLLLEKRESANLEDDLISLHEKVIGNEVQLFWKTSLKDLTIYFDPQHQSIPKENEENYFPICNYLLYSVGKSLILKIMSQNFNLKIVY